MFARYLNAPLLLLLWQVGPVQTHRDETGRVRLSLGFGRGNFSFRDAPGYPAGVDCAGEGYPGRAPYTSHDQYSSTGVAAEIWAARKIRIQAAAGNVRDGSGERHGGFFAVQPVWEQQHFGLGIGLARLGSANPLQPSASARVGSLERISLRADYNNPGSAMALVGGPRVGLGWNQGGSRKPRILAGLARTPLPDSARRVGGFLEAAFPLGFLNSGLSLNGFLSGAYQGNERKQIYSFGVGIWVQP